MYNPQQRAALKQLAEARESLLAALDNAAAHGVPIDDLREFNAALTHDLMSKDPS